MLLRAKSVTFDSSTTSRVSTECVSRIRPLGETSRFALAVRSAVRNVAFGALCMLSCATRKDTPTSVRPACRTVVLAATSIRSEPGFAVKRFCCAR